jgi:hypothetical protein
MFSLSEPEPSQPFLGETPQVFNEGFSCHGEWQRVTVSKTVFQREEIF